MPSEPPATDPFAFFLTPLPLLAISIAGVFLLLVVLLIRFPHLREKLHIFYKIYHGLCLVPVYALAGVLYVITLGHVNFFKKLAEKGFHARFEQVYRHPRIIFTDMRQDPAKYRLWVGFFICIAVSLFDELLFSWVAQQYYHGQESILLGLLSTAPPEIANPWQRWILRAFMGIWAWIPTKILIHLLMLLFHKPARGRVAGRSWWDRIRLVYIAWAYIILADTVWMVGLVLALLWGTWEGLVFAWVGALICGIIEFLYQQYSLQEIYQVRWGKAFLIWGVSLLPVIGANFVLNGVLGPLIVSLFPFP